ncbi:hypothetical protein TSAR_012880 [Trichomalopsis sarcophagae]|uniref:MULE transposase domain-containing protein n=1 Tax=Trichomalopsis sarcophagae TaxID=543379 RepID=A0A232EGT5_9HYME|nr:hypothetical protein TSAR_012880 [Trichomalopsis sarcophagae]
MIFSTRNNLKVLSRIEFWLADSAFDLCPDMFGQIYTIHGLYENTCLPLVYFLLTRKDEETYRRVLQELKKLRKDLNPKKIMMDLELAAHNAFEAEFEEVDKKHAVFDVLKAFKEDYATTNKIIADLRTGVDPEPPCKKYASNNERISRIVRKYGTELYENDSVQYLNDTASLLSE